jgi:hypothetical protein
MWAYKMRNFDALLIKFLKIRRNKNNIFFFFANIISWSDSVLKLVQGFEASHHSTVNIFLLTN